MITVVLNYLPNDVKALIFRMMGLRLSFLIRNEGRDYRLVTLIRSLRVVLTGVRNSPRVTRSESTRSEEARARRLTCLEVSVTSLTFTLDRLGNLLRRVLRCVCDTLKDLYIINYRTLLLLTNAVLHRLVLTLNYYRLDLYDLMNDGYFITLLATSRAIVVRILRTIMDLLNGNYDDFYLLGRLGNALGLLLTHANVNGVLRNLYYNVNYLRRLLLQFRL